MEKETVSALLNVLIFLPLLGIPFILLAQEKLAKTFALVFSLIPFGLSLLIYSEYLKISTLENATDGYVFQTSLHWLGMAFGGQWATSYDIKFITGVDGISIYLVLLTTFLFPLSIWFSWTSISSKEKAYYALLLLLEAGVLGVFLSLDLILFYVFFEVGLIPMYFLIGIWGGKNSTYAAVKFFLYTLVGSFMTLIAILYLGSYAGDAVNSGVFTSDLFKIQKTTIPADIQAWLFWGFALSFLIKVPVFPVHTWLPDAHVQAPTAGSVILAGVLLKMGTYGLVRFCLPLFPVASVQFAPLVCTLGVIGITYGAMACMVQTDVKKLIAYSSVAHMGFVVLGIFAMTPEALSGSVLQMINHGISTPALFFLIGMIYDRRHSREIADFQGIAKQLPIFTLFFMIATMSSIGLPGLNGFVGEFLILLGSYSSKVISGGYAIISATGVIIAAVYMLWMFRRVMFGELDKQENKELTDLTKTEVAILVPLVILMFVIGFHATPFLKEIGKSSDVIVQTVLEAGKRMAEVR
ncbi:MAG: NADH-quinone oxidoreductase subunit M [Bacteroidia bacterium]|nr:NADH-quinone oxidoreductase subunit M [Bacteroidia bacterium]